MKSQTVAQYDAPHQFEPLLPSEAKMALGAVAAPAAQRELRGLLASMNSYYTNRIEGEHTRPSDIERALLRDFSSNTEQARKQRLALAHIHTELACEDALDARRAAGEACVPWLYSGPALGWLHGELFKALPTADLPDFSLSRAGSLRCGT